jgi:hypothetical protein
MAEVRMNRRRVLLLVFAAFALLLAGCAPPWAVVQQTTPNPFVNQRKFAIAPTDFSALRVGSKSEAEYLAGKDEAQQRSFQADKTAANEALTGALITSAHAAGVEIVLATGPTDGPFVIRPALLFFEPGFYAGILASPSRLDVSLKITSPDGAILDEVLMSHRTAAPTMNNNLLGAMVNLDKMSSGGRLRADAAWIGEAGGKYLLTRIAP